MFFRVSQRKPPTVSLSEAIPARVEYWEWLLVAPQFAGSIFETADFFCQIEESLAALKNGTVDEDEDDDD